MEYPNLKRTSNIAQHTQYGRIIIDDKILEDENPDNNPKFIRGGKFIEDYETGDASKIGRWFHLPKFEDLCNEWESTHDVKDNDVPMNNEGLYIIQSRKKENTK